MTKSALLGMMIMNSRLVQTRGLVLTVLLFASCSRESHVTGGGGNLIEPPDTLWTRVFDGGQWDHGGNIDLTMDGGCVLVGQNGAQRAWIIKTDNMGNPQWESTPAGGFWSVGNDIQQTTDGGFIIAGTIITDTTGWDDVLLLKVNASGVKEWEKAFGGASSERAQSIQQTFDGGYIMAAVTESYGAGYYDFWLIKTDADGNMLWNKAFGGSATDYAYSAQQTNDGGYVIAGHTYSFEIGSDFCHYWLIKTDSAGEKQWDHLYAGGLSVSCWDVRLTDDGGYILGGTVSSDICLVKTDGEGNQQWSSAFQLDYESRGSDLETTSDGGYIITGWILDGPDSDDLLVLKSDAIGGLEWMLTMGGARDDWGMEVRQSANGGYLIGGQTKSFTPSGSDLWLICLESDILGGFQVP